MQLLDSLPKRIPNTATEQLLSTFEDIACKVEIKSNFSIHHKDYQALEFPGDVVNRLLQMPPLIQNQFLNSQLCYFLYGIYYNGNLQTSLAANKTPVSPSLSQKLENNTFLGIDLNFYEKLHANNLGQGYLDPGWRVLKKEQDGSIVVKQDELTLYIEPAKHLLSTEQSPSVGDFVAIRMPRNLVQNGFYMAVSNVGAHHQTNSDLKPQIVRFYFHLSPEGAVAVMNSLTRQLNDLNIPFAFKALYNPSDYLRYDSAVLYFEKSQYEIVSSVLQKVYQQNQAHFRSEVPLFTKLMAPGLALAEEPNQPFVAQESFGLNRCRLVANGLLEAWQQENTSTEGCIDYIIKQFSLSGIDLESPYLNADSEDTYTPLNL